jgi:hypothetical protein
LWRRANPDRAKALSRDHYAENRDAYLTRAAAQYAADPERGKQKAAAWKAANPDRARVLDYLSSHRNRARELGAEIVGEIDLDVIWQRDAAQCWICGLTIDPSLSAIHRMSWSLDHDIPLTRGGEHSMWNVALAHMGCNASKGDKILGKVPRWQLEPDASPSA